MILVDTSVWVDHLRVGNAALIVLLEEERVLAHPFIIGELACGQMRNRREILELLARLPAAMLAAHDDVLSFVEHKQLAGKGIGWIDAHLLASAILSGAGLLTLDRRLSQVARALKLLRR